MKISLKLVNGEELQFKVDLNSCVIGRSPKCDIVIPHEGMSRQHCQIDVQGGEIYITDLGSTNGVLIDGQRLEVGKRTLYFTYLTLSFGAIQSMQIELEENIEVQAPHPLPFKTSSRNRSVKFEGNVDETNSKVKKQKSFKPQIKEKVTKSSFIMVNVLVVLLLGAVVFYYATKEEELVLPVAPKAKPYQAPKGNGDTF
jgi:pSer/pThr/pTyr-binding forkhead associated (FHA) protein